MKLTDIEKLCEGPWTIGKSDTARTLVPLLLEVARAASNPDLRKGGDDAYAAELRACSQAFERLDQALAALEKYEP